MIQILSSYDTRNKLSNLRKEAELLLCCARTHLNFSTTELLKTLLQENIDWEYLLNIAHCHKVMPLLYWSLKNTCSSSVPQAEFDKLRNYFQSNNYSNLILTQELIKLLRLFESQKIPVIPFKGPVLAASIYRNLSLRRIGDLDILVQQQDFQKVADLLSAQGYKLKIDVPWECHFVRDDGSSNIDLHRDIVPKHLCCSVSDNYWWEHIEPFSLAGTKISNLTPEASLLILCLNGTKECWQSLNRICDVAELIRTHPEMDWNHIMEEFTILGCKRLISLGLILAGELLAAPLTEEVWQWVKSDSVAKSLAFQVREQLFSDSAQEIGEVERTIFHIKTRERLRDKFQSFLGLMNHSGWLTPTQKDLDFLSLPLFLYWLYFLIRPIRVLKDYGLSPLRKLLLPQ
ncbi:MAG: nucleotidyltransferase family protein [Cyanomargarita calcarea GSE-NOS-MK-12-04C]|jgi:hypothetical protein|uniref:Nucleotidyltransferase family protein n=1 Tax=Cyanomargarita calcarea GSE-NOS-MK-12-04C TaxID=2839659 RepID=A0A951QP23_9CYAN|nr:nucleotidyltransferase family protein [Cyanomargarita calcarea GSE-NOS-MK-12-04C]